jgi:predicted HD superfamily hydrolase involved in NAD metabolism
VHDWADLEQALCKRVSGDRLSHTMRVVATARVLAARHGADVKKAEVAALLHDYARAMPSPELLELGRQYSLISDAIEEATPALLHGPVASALLYEQGLVSDPDILAAIRWHTTGRAGMSQLERVIWVADYVEPGRTFPGAGDVRMLAEQDLDKALLLGLDQTFRYVLDRKWLLHTSSVQAYNWLLNLSRTT